MSWEEWTENAKFPEDYKKELLESYGKALKDLKLVTGTGIGAYVISDETAKILAELDSRPQHDNPYDAIDADLTDFKSALSNIRQLAKKDLKVR
jgi:hypothetical protein